MRWTLGLVVFIKKGGEARVQLERTVPRAGLGLESLRQEEPGWPSMARNWSLRAAESGPGAA